MVYELDRIPRSLTILHRINAQGAQFRSLTETIDTSTAAGRMQFLESEATEDLELVLVINQIEKTGKCLPRRDKLRSAEQAGVGHALMHGEA